MFFIDLSQSVLVTLLAVALAMYLTRKSLKQGTSPPAAAPPAPSTPVPAKQPEEVNNHFSLELDTGHISIIFSIYSLMIPGSGRRHLSLDAGQESNLWKPNLQVFNFPPTHMWEKRNFNKEQSFNC